jgi:putative PEP-CTERM system TPR-repeat lipoprotein
MLAVTQEATGDTGLAADTQNRVVQLRPGSPEPLLHLAALYTRTGNRDGAIEALQRAQKAAPDNRQIDRDLIALLVSQGKIEQALRHARNLQERAPKFAGGFVFEGDVLLLQNKAAEAERAYRAALKVEPTSGQAASKVAMALYAGGRTAEGNGFARKWLTDNPPDPFMRLLLADRALGVRDLPKAAELYKAVLARDSNNVTALNNLAWIGGETGDANAVSYAERAARLAPRNASVLETLGTLLVKDGESARGLELLVRACALAPARLDLRLSHARALVAAGQKDAARKELRELAEGKDDSTEKRAAAELLQKL